MYPGGNAVNVAVHAQRNGAHAAYLGAVGTDRAGEVVLGALRRKASTPHSPGSSTGPTRTPRSRSSTATACSAPVTWASPVHPQPGRPGGRGVRRRAHRRVLHARGPAGELAEAAHACPSTSPSGPGTTCSTTPRRSVAIWSAAGRGPGRGGGPGAPGPRPRPSRSRSRWAPPVRWCWRRAGLPPSAGRTDRGHPGRRRRLHRPLLVGLARGEPISTLSAPQLLTPRRPVPAYGAFGHRSPSPARWTTPHPQPADRIPDEALNT